MGRQDYRTEEGHLVGLIYPSPARTSGTMIPLPNSHVKFDRLIGEDRQAMQLFEETAKIRQDRIPIR